MIDKKLMFFVLKFKFDGPTKCVVLLLTLIR